MAVFSFGTAVAAQLYSLLAQEQLPTPQALLLSGTAVQRFRHIEVQVPSHTYLVHGADDEVVPFSEAMAFAKEHKLAVTAIPDRSEEHTSELQSRGQLVCRLLL